MVGCNSRRTYFNPLISIVFEPVKSELDTFHVRVEVKLDDLCLGITYFPLALDIKPC
jgi:hypothetical protein